MIIMPNLDYLKKYIKYLSFGESCEITTFDDDWEPIGPMLRADMKRFSLIYEKDGEIFLEKENP